MISLALLTLAASAFSATLHPMERMTYSEAQAFCRRNGGGLTVPTQDIENRQAYKVLSTETKAVGKAYWIGINRCNNQKRWNLPGGQYDRFTAGEKRKDPKCHSCAAFYPYEAEFYWQAIDCNLKLPPICDESIGKQDLVNTCPTDECPPLQGSPSKFARTAGSPLMCRAADDYAVGNAGVFCDCSADCGSTKCWCPEAKGPTCCGAETTPETTTTPATTPAPASSDGSSNLKISMITFVVALTCIANLW